MKLYPVTTTLTDKDGLQNDLRSAHEVGALLIGSTCLFFRARFKTYYIPYEDIDRCFRRVTLMPARLCCGQGDLELESLIVCSGGKEVAVIDLPGKRAAMSVMEELKEKLPHAELRAPKKTEAGKAADGKTEADAASPEAVETEADAASSEAAEAEADAASSENGDKA